jgi:hypothetical protein
VLAVGTDRGLCLFDAEESRSALEIAEVAGLKLGGIERCAIDPLKLKVSLLCGKSEIVNLIGE